MTTSFDITASRAAVKRILHDREEDDETGEVA